MSAEDTSKESHDSSVAADSRDQMGHRHLTLHVTKIPREYPFRIIAPKHRPIRRTAPGTHYISKKEMIESPYDVLDTGRHVVLLGAGASKAAFPNGDKSSKGIPLMANLMQRRRVPVHHGDQGGNVMASGKSSRINRQYKTKYRIRNWREYERGLRSRGDVTIWLSEDAIAAWIPPKNGLRGGQRRYSNLAIRSAFACSS